MFLTEASKSKFILIPPTKWRKNIQRFALIFRKKKKSKHKKKDRDEEPEIEVTSEAVAGSSSGSAEPQKHSSDAIGYYSGKTKAEIAFLKKKEERVSHHTVL